MKTETSNATITLVPEDAEELQALHTLQYRGVAGTQLIGKLPEGAQLLITMGPDYIADDRRARAERERQAKRPSTRLLNALRNAWRASNI